MEWLSRQAIEANENHKSSLEAYTNKLQAELLAVDKLIAAVEQLPEDESQEDPSDKWCLHAENAFKPTGIIDLTQTNHESSPFHEESLRRARYMQATQPKPFSNSEKRYLEKAIVKENKRIMALRAKQSGGNAFEAVVGTNEVFLNNIDGIDWTSVARDVSAFNSPQGGRTAQECKVRWLGTQHPKFNHEKWSDAEEERLHALVESKRDTRIDWVEISDLLGTNRTPMDCIRTYQAGSRPSFRWTKVLDKKLMEAVQKHGSSNWTLVATAVSPEVSANQCQIRYGRTLNPDIKRGKFTAEEDQLLHQAIETYGQDWVKVAQAVPGRTNVQCRDRYMLHMASGTAEAAWTEEEDTRLRDAVMRLGRQWEKIREDMGCARGRSQYANRYKVLVRKDARTDARPSAGRDASVSVSQESPSDALEPAVCAQEDLTGVRSVGQDGTSSIDRATEDPQMANDSKGRGAKRGRKTARIMPLELANPAREGDTLNTDIPKRPRPRPRRKSAMAAVGSGTADRAASSSVSNPGTEREIAQQSHPTSMEAEAAIAQTSESLCTPGEQVLDSAAASFGGEYSDLTDLEDLEAERPLKKKARSNTKPAKIATPTSTGDPTGSLIQRPSKRKTARSLAPRTMRTRSFADSTA